jgi:hypothetical protein
VVQLAWRTSARAWKLEKYEAGTGDGHACVVTYVIAYLHIGFSTTLKDVAAAPQVTDSEPLRMAPLGHGPAPPVTGTVNVLNCSVGVAIWPM